MAIFTSLYKISSATKWFCPFPFRVPTSRLAQFLTPVLFLLAFIPANPLAIGQQQIPPAVNKNEAPSGNHSEAPPGKQTDLDSEVGRQNDNPGPENIPHYLESRYDQIAWLVTHNAMSNREEGWWFPNQSYGISKQLKDGVRGLMLDIHMIDDKPYLLHGRAILGKIPLATTLTDIKTFVKKNPKAILTLIFESYAPAKQVREAFEAAGLLDLLHQQPAARSWPNIKDMIAEDKRVVVFTDAGGGDWPGYHDVWDFCQETHFSVKQTKDFSYQRHRGKQSNPLFILNHFLTRPTAGVDLAQQANSAAILKPRLDGCQKLAMRFPNFVAVDFYEIGDTTSLLREFNQTAMRTRHSEIQSTTSKSGNALQQK